MSNLYPYPTIRLKMEKPGKREMFMIKTVIRLRNDMVMVFDDEGERSPEYQGQYEDVKEKILVDATARTVFNHWFDNSSEPEVVARLNW
jgi:hypothetical protein